VHIHDRYKETQRNEITPTAQSCVIMSDGELKHYFPSKSQILFQCIYLETNLIHIVQCKMLVQVNLDLNIPSPKATKKGINKIGIDIPS